MATQISAVVSDETKERLEKYAKANGLKKGYLIETALLHHLQAIENLPQEIIIPANLTVSQKVLNELNDLLKNPPKPTEAMLALFEND